MKRALERWIAAALRPLLRRVAALLYAELERVRREVEIGRARDTLACMQSCAHTVRTGGRIHVTDPRSAAVGNDVFIGEDAWFDTVGGLTVGDRARIGRGVTILTADRTSAGDGPGVPKPVLIGRDVRIGDRACILPGVRLGDGAVVNPASVVAGDVPDQPRPGAASAEAGEPHADDPRAKVFFVVSTGRSGSLAICEILAQHPRIACAHEPRPQMIRLSTERAHGRKSEEAVEAELREVFCRSSVFPGDRWWGESDQKYWNLVEPLARLMPGSRFVWLIRDGRDVVASTFGQEWFPSAARPGNPVAGDLYDRWLYYRLDGAACGAFSREQWNRLTLFEKNCWHWSHVNREIERSFLALPEQRRVRVRMEDLRADVDAVFRLLSVEPLPVKVEKRNQATYAVKRWPQWGAAERAAFDKWCGSEMDRWYPGWRAARGT